MSGSDIGFSYWLARTEFSMTATRHISVVPNETGGWVERPTLDVQVVTEVLPQPDGRLSVIVEKGLLEKVSAKFTFDDRGLIESINTEASQDVTPLISLVGLAAKGVGFLALDSPDLPEEPGDAGTIPTDLAQEWESQNEELASRAKSFEIRIRALLALIAKAKTSVGAVAEAGAALDVLQSQYSAINQLKREWIAGHARTVESLSWRLGTKDLVWVQGTELPAELADPTIPAAQGVAAGLGVLLAVADPVSRKKEYVLPTERDQTDNIVLRGSRPVAVAVYRQDAESNSGWMLEAESVIHLDVVDEFSPLQDLSLEGSWLRSNSLELSYHPDKSLKSYGVSGTPGIGGVISSVGTAVDSVAEARKAWLTRPSDVEIALERDKTQLEILKTASELEQLANARAPKPH